MKKICKSIVFILVLICSAISPVFSVRNRSVSAEDNASITSIDTTTSSSLSDSSTPKIYLEAEKVDSNGVAQIGSSGYKVGFYIKATAPVENVTVSWRTRDMTAIALKGDYNKKDTTYTLNGTSSSLLSVVVYRNGVATRVDRKLARMQVNDDLTADAEITRNFFIEITDISCDKSVATIDNSRKQLIATAGREYTLSVTKIFDEKNSKNYMSYFSSYEFIKESTWASYTPRNQRINNAIYIDKSPNIQDGKKYYSYAAYPSTTLFNEFITRGYADLYAIIRADTYEDKAIGNSDNIRVSIVYADNHEYICQYDIEYGGWSSEHTYDMLQMQTSSRYTTNPGKVLVGDTISRHYYDGRYYYYYKEEYWEVKDPNRPIQVEFWDYEDYEGRYFYDVKVNTIIADTKAPEVTGYYLQQEPLKKGDKLGLSVRFSEPVQLIGNKRKPIISARINNNANYYADFEYVAGSGTDTLYFEWTPTDKNIDITSFTLCDFLNASSIADYSISMNVVQNPQIFRSDDTDSFSGDSSKFTYYEPVTRFDDQTLTLTDKFMNHNQLSKPILNETLSYKVDLRQPNIHTDVKASDMASKYVEVPIIIEALKSDGKLYYSWTNSTLTPDKYENEITNLSDIYTIRATDMNGRYYLHIKAVSTYGKEQILVVGPFKFDGEPPNISQNVVGDLTSRTFKLNITDGAETTDWSSGVADVTLTVAKDIDGKDVVKTYSYNGSGAKIFTKNVIVSAIDLGLGENEFGTFYIFVTTYDNLGNKSQTEPTKYKFDRRTFFDVQFESAKSNDVDKVLDISTDNYKVIDITEDVWLNFSSSDTTGAVTKLIVKNANNETFEISNHVFTPTSKKFCIKSDFVPGYYTISFTTTESGTVKYSQETTFYFTKNMQDEGLNYYTKITNGLLLTNSVYQLNSDLPYYYMDKDGNIQNVRYGNSSKPATFSSKYEAIKYLKYMEYQDLFPVQINATQANLLNGRSSPNFLKAPNENMVAQENQIWIRYKTPSFDKDPATSQWAYYYYQGDSLTLRQEYFSMNLLSSISIVAERLAKNYGTNVMLVGEGNVNKYNEPYLDKDQIHSTFESVSKTKCDISFDKAIFYDGDTKIYNSTIEESGREYNLATNLEISSNGFNKLFYKGNNNDSYTEIDLTKYTNLSQVITSSGVYEIIELDTQGARKYSVYVDKDAPTLTGYMQDSSSEDVTEWTFDKSSQGITFAKKSFSFGQFSSIEKDELAYVAVWRYLTNKTGELLNVYLRSDLENNSYTLENGDYHIEVYDRSGNGYSFVIRVNAQSFDCSITEKENEYLLVTCTGEENEIQSYEIYLNGELVTSKYSQRLKLEQSGNYTIRIIDIFGKEFYKEVSFERKYPLVSWRYYDKDLDSYVSFDEETTKKMKITRVNDTTYQITTSALLQFKYDDLYTYKFEGSVDYSESGISHLVQINSLQGFTLKVSYANYKEATITYICEVDNTAPNISVKNEVEVFDYDEIKQFNEQLENGNVGDELTYDTIKYSKRNSLDFYLASGDTVESKMLKLSATDSYGVSLIKVYLNDSLLIEETENFSNITLSRFGNYRIEAYDIFENKSEFTFTNNIQEHLKYYVDQIEKESSESSLQYFDNSGVFQKIDYGKDVVELLLKTGCVLNLKITTNTSIYSAIEITDGKIYFLTFKIAQNQDEYGPTGKKYTSAERSMALFDSSLADTIVNDWYLIVGKNQCGKNIYAKYDSNGNISIKIENDSNETCVVEGRVKLSSVEPFYFKAELSQAKSDIVIKNDEGQTITTNKDEIQIKINKPFHIDQASLPSEIEQIRVYYSHTSSFGDYVLVYDNPTFNAQEFTNNDFYLIEIVNRYGNITKYYIWKSENFGATISTELVDGTTFDYSVAYSSPVFSNKTVSIMANSANVTCQITKDGQIYTNATIVAENGTTLVTLTEIGTYSVTLIDEFGNKYQANVQISLKNLTFDESLIYGYNEKAKKRSEGYTNQTLSISKEKLTSNNICYISVTHNEQETILLNLISETKTEIANDEILLSCIGKDGDGEYSILFRDKFGNKMPEKVIHYKKDTTLKLSRRIQSSNADLDYDVLGAEEKGFWANSSLSFDTSATQYDLLIDGKAFTCPQTRSFSSGADEGEIVYDISYLDEYGNEHKFKAHLFRQKLTLEIPSAIKTIEEDGVLITKNNLYFVVPNNATCTYTLNDGVEKPYTSNQILKQDGHYRFTIKDLAGNISDLAIQKDTAVEFEMTEEATGYKVINGGIVCSERGVKFKALNSDSAYIKYVFKDGELLEDYADNKFTGDGKWEILLSDSIGNESYFTFQIITHNLSKFDYTVPYGYKITEIWFKEKDSDETSISRMEFVTGEGTAINLTQNGKYTVVMLSQTTGLSSSFRVTINSAKPQIKLVGCEENETTLNDITISGYKLGDKVEIYRNGKLYKTVDILTSQTDAPVITEGGNYTIVVTNEAGVSTSVSFVRKNIPNAPGNVLIIVLILAVASVVFIGLVYRQRSKVDE